MPQKISIKQTIARGSLRGSREVRYESLAVIKVLSGVQGEIKTLCWIVVARDQRWRRFVIYKYDWSEDRQNQKKIATLLTMYFNRFFMV